MSEEKDFPVQRMTVVLDEINGKMDRLGEGFGAMVKKMDGFRERMDRMEREMVTKSDLKIVIEQQSKDIMNALGETNQRIDGTNKRIEDVVGALNTHGIAVVAA